MLLLEVAMHIKDIQEDECETAIKVKFRDPPNRKVAESKGRDPMRPKRLICQQFIRITLACWKFLRNNVNEWLIALAKCPSVHDCCLHLAEGNLHARGLQQLQICERIQNGVLSAAPA